MAGTDRNSSAGLWASSLRLFGGVRAEIEALRRDVIAASREAGASRDVQSAMSRTFYTLGATLAVVAAFGVAALLHEIH